MSTDKNKELKEKLDIDISESISFDYEGEMNEINEILESIGYPECMTEIREKRKRDAVEKEKYFIYDEKYVVKQDIKTGDFYSLEMNDREKAWKIIFAMTNKYEENPEKFLEVPYDFAEEWIEVEETNASGHFFTPMMIYEKYKKFSALETAIRIYHVNKDNDIAVYMVFSELGTERVFLPHNNAGHLMSLIIDGQEIIPVFSRRERMEEGEPVYLKACHISDVLDELLKSRKNLIVNPFSEENHRFFVPYEAIERLLIPAMKK